MLADFFGPLLWPRIRECQPVTWGWKDPRTSLTFPIWLRVFPRARCLHVVRSGIDVADSLRRRSQKQRRNLLKRLIRIDYSPETLGLAYGFHLWEVYVSFILGNRHLVGKDRYLQIRYEDLLAQPVETLRQVVDFAGYPADQARLRIVCQRVDSGRLQPFEGASDEQEMLRSFYSRPLVGQLGYDPDHSG